MYALTAKGMRYMDEYTIGMGIQSSVLMENAAKGIVDEVRAYSPEGDAKILVLCGSGNNGGDAICAARWLLHMDYDVSAYFVGDPDRLSRELSHQMKILAQMEPEFKIPGIDYTGRDIEVLQDEYDIIIDGIYGTGLNRRLGYNYAKFIEYINTKNGYKIAIDIPSGLNGTTGQIMDAVFIADTTITFGSYKTGMFFGDGRKCCGDVKVVDIGIPKSGYREVEDKLFICDNEFLDDSRDMALVPRPEASHKGTFGTVGIIVSPGSMLGASMLATKAAYRAGCGLVKIFCPNKYIGFFNVSIPEAVVVPYKTDDVVGAMGDFVDDVDVVLIGPGLNEDTTGRLLVKQLLAGKTPVVFDAGALNLIAKNLKPFRKRRCACVITPHLGEMAKLCGEDINVVDKNRIGFARKFSAKYNVSMVVKSDVSVVSLLNEGRQRLFLNTVGNSGLATAGSGDVLAGVISSMVAQGNTLNNSLLYGVMIHGRAAERYAVDEDKKRKMMAGDIVENIF